MLDKKSEGKATQLNLALLVEWVQLVTFPTLYIEKLCVKPLCSEKHFTFEESIILAFINRFLENTYHTFTSEVSFLCATTVRFQTYSV